MSDTAKCILSGSNFTQKASVSGNGGVAMMKSKDVTIESCKFVGGGAVNGGGLALTGPKVGSELWLSSSLINIADSLVFWGRLQFPQAM